jgi:glycolate oxidase iron-sulfur subunit
VSGPRFDVIDPPSREAVEDCVHCGFCLPSCPTYLLWGEEMDSPRGRIDLVAARLDGAPVDDAFVGHIDACLGCLACVTACPSGVRYDRIVEPTRAQIERARRRGPGERALRALLFALFPRPERLRSLRPLLAAGYRSGMSRRFARWGRRRVPALATLAELLPAPDGAPGPPPESAPVGPERLRAGLVTGCVQAALLPRVNLATARVLAAAGARVLSPEGQGCCGALSLHAGRREEARRYARRLIDAFATAPGGVAPDVIVTNAAGCGTAMRGYGELLAEDAAYRAAAAGFAERVRDVTEVLVRLGRPPATRRTGPPRRVAYQDACHLAHGQGVRQPPRDLLAGLPGVQLLELPEPDICCGSAGVHNLLQPATGRELGDRKAALVIASGADVVATGNPGCLLQLQAALHRAGSPVEVRHVVELLGDALPPAAAGSACPPGGRSPVA